MFIPSPDSLDPPQPLPQPPRLPTPPPGSLYPAHGTPVATPWPVSYTPAWFVNVQPVPLLLYYHLCFNPASRDPVLNWDLVHPPEFARVHDPYDRLHRIKQPDLAREAIQPSASKAWIMSVNPIVAPWFARWGPIIIEKDPSQPISVGDILNAIYHYFRTPLTKDDTDFVALEPGNKKRLRQVLNIRARDSYELDPVVLAAGYRRVDILGSYRRFKGLDIVAMPDNTWRLHIDFLPGPVTRVF